MEAPAKANEYVADLRVMVYTIFRDESNDTKHYFWDVLQICEVSI